MGGSAAGGGGGGAFPFLSLTGGDADSASLACFCSIYDLMKSAFSAIWSSENPIASSSLSSPFHDGSLVSNGNSLCPGEAVGGGGGATCIVGAGGSSAGVICVGACDRPSRLPNIDRPTPPDFPFATGVGPCPRVEANGVWRVSLLAFFSRSIIFLMNVFASFSSANDKPAGQSSNSKVWKNVRS